MSTPMVADSQVAGSPAPLLDAAVGPRQASPAWVRPRGHTRALSVWGQMMLSLPATAWMICDLVVLLVATTQGYDLFVVPADLTHPDVQLWQALVVFSLCLVASSLVFGLNQRDTLLSRSRILIRMLLTTVLTVVLAYAVIYVVMYSTVARRVTALAMGSFLVAGTGLRVLVCWAVRRDQRGLLIIGPGLLIEAFARAAADEFLPHYRLTGFIDDSSDAREGIGGIPRLGGACDIPAVCRQHGVHDIVVGQEAARDPTVMNWLLPCLRMGCRVTNEATFYEKATGQILVDQITPHWFLFADLQAHCEEVAAFKRAVDLTAAAAGLLLTLPLWPLIALAIKLNDGGPAFYSQDRVGQNGLVFKLFKFRTMRVDAEPAGAVWATRHDPRVTRVGRLLRRTRLDELPQLYNVLLGQMSLVGPRPERPDIVQELCTHIPYFSERHLVKPGITGWAQISFRYGNTIEDAKRKLQFDLYYLKHMSFELDIVVLFRTLGTFLRGAC